MKDFKFWTSLLPWVMLIISGIVAFNTLQINHRVLAQDVDEGMKHCWTFKSNIDTKLDLIIEDIGDIKTDVELTKRDVEYLKEQSE